MKLDTHLRKELGRWKFKHIINEKVFLVIGEKFCLKNKFPFYSEHACNYFLKHV